MSTNFRWANWLGVAFFALFGVLAFPQKSKGRFSGEVPYRFEVVWPTAIRLLRVDLSCTFSDRDMEGGFIFFECPGPPRFFRGSLEIASLQNRSGRVRITIQTPSLPSFFERLLFERLLRKLRDEQGDKESKAPPSPSREGASSEASHGLP
ncbi:MAG: hypothetical protein N2515_10220 [Deltaproteobacteria bacterium]|nr:hypothetical protein [Deltaproteobacteria bacterium]